MTKNEAIRLVAAFEAGTLCKEQFTHAAHFIVAAAFCLRYPLPVAIEKIRDGIRTFNVRVGGQNTDTAGYHETITLFYAMAIARWVITEGVHTLDDHVLCDLLNQPFAEKGYVHRFYSTELLLSRHARLHWVEADGNNLSHRV